MYITIRSCKTFCINFSTLQIQLSYRLRKNENSFSNVSNEMGTNVQQDESTKLRQEIDNLKVSLQREQEQCKNLMDQLAAEKCRWQKVKFNFSSPEMLQKSKSNPSPSCSCYL